MKWISIIGNCEQAMALRGSPGRMIRFILAIWIAAVSGCAALHPLNGIPAKHLPRELRGQHRSGKQTIDLSRLGQATPPEYLLDTGDVLGIYIEGVLGKRDDVPPVFFPANGEVPPTLGFPFPIRDDGTISLPLIPPVMARGLTVRRFEETLRKAYTQDQLLLQQGQDRILVSLQRPRSYQVLVLRQEAVSNTGLTPGLGTVNLGNAKRGTGQLVTLPAYQNDVLHALTQTGGLPGLDAQNAVYILRRPAARPVVIGPAGQPLFTVPPSSELDPPGVTRTPGATDGRQVSHTAIRQIAAFEQAPDMLGHSRPDAVWPLPGNGSRGPRNLPVEQLNVPAWSNAGGATSPYIRTQATQYPPPPAPPPIPSLPPLPPVEQLPLQQSGLPIADLPDCLQGYGSGTQVIRIPIRLGPGDVADFSEEDIILHDNDIVFIESRETEIFYTGGLLGGGQYMLPRDYDLDVLGAISIASGRQQSGSSGAGIGNRVGGISAINQDISVSASDVVILRQLPDGNQIPIRVSLPRALRDPQERILIQPGDYIILQYTRFEAFAAFIERNLLAGSLIGLATTQNKSSN